MAMACNQQTLSILLWSDLVYWPFLSIVIEITLFFTGQNNFTPSLLLSLQVVRFHFFSCLSHSTQGVKMFFLKTNLIMSLPCHSPFKNFPLSSSWKLESWICFSACFSGLISCCFSPVHVLHCIPTGLAFGLVLWLPFALFHSTYFIHEAWETCPTSSSVPSF